MLQSYCIAEFPVPYHFKTKLTKLIRISQIFSPNVIHVPFIFSLCFLHVEENTFAYVPELLIFI